MEDSVLYAEVERLDGELQSTPLVLRPLDIYNTLIGREERDDEALLYLQKIADWFIQRYGEEARWDGVLAREPIFLRGRVHLLDIVTGGVTEKGVSAFLSNLENQGQHASLEEWKYVSRISMEAAKDFSAIQNMEMTPSLLSEEQRQLFRRAWFDLRSAGPILLEAHDVQGSIVHSHEAAEKYLKAALLHTGVNLQKLGKGDLRHDLGKIVKALEKRQRRFAYVSKQAIQLGTWLGNMNMRYASVKRSQKEAAEAFRYARHCGGFIAQQIYMDSIRGAPDITLQPGHYYHDGSVRNYRFCGYEQKEGKTFAKMHLLEMEANGQKLDAEIRFDAPCSFHYAEITNVDEVRRLELRYRAVMAKSRTERPPVDSRTTTIEMDHESFSSMVTFRTPVRK